MIVMLYAVLSNLRSLREVCLGFAVNATRMNHLGIDHMICRTTLSDANKRRKSSFFGSIYRMLYSRYAPFLSDSNNTEYRNTVFWGLGYLTVGRWENKVYYIIIKIFISIFSARCRNCILYFLYFMWLKMTWPIFNTKTALFRWEVRIIWNGLENFVPLHCRRRKTIATHSAAKNIFQVHQKFFPASGRKIGSPNSASVN